MSAELVPMPRPRPRTVVRPAELAAAVLEAAGWRGRPDAEVVLEVLEKTGAGLSEVEVIVDALERLGLIVRRERGTRYRRVWLFRTERPRNGGRGRR